MKTDDIFERLYRLAGVKSDAALAKELGVTPQAVANSKKRDSVPYEKICTWAEAKGHSLDYILLGKDEAPSAEHEGPTRQATTWLSASQMADLLHFIFDELDSELFLRERMSNSDEDAFWFLASVFHKVVGHLPRDRSDNSDDVLELVKHFSKEEIESYNRVLKIARRNAESASGTGAAKEKGGGGTTQTIHGNVGQIGGGDINNNFGDKDK